MPYELKKVAVVCLIGGRGGRDVPPDILISRKSQSLLPKLEKVCRGQMNRKNRFKIKNFPKIVLNGWKNSTIKNLPGSSFKYHRCDRGEYKNVPRPQHNITKESKR